MNGPTRAPRVALGGFMAVGKSTLGRRLADELRVAFVDLDATLRAALGVAALGDWFSAHGEASFRAHESAALAHLADGPPGVLALGGGTLHAADNRARLAAAGWRVIVLHADWSDLAARLEATPDRPLAAQAHALYTARLPGYRAAADHFVDVTGLDEDAAFAALRAAVHALP